MTEVTQALQLMYLGLSEINVSYLFPWKIYKYT